MPGNPYKQKTLMLSKHLCLKVVPHGSQKVDVWISTPMRHPVTGEEMMDQWMERKVDNNNLGDFKDLIDAAVAHNFRVQEQRNK